MTEAAFVLFWPAALAYGEAALAYAGELVRPGRTRGLAIWGVRIGWLAQTALLLAQAASADGFPWGTWAGSLNLFVWMCVGVYLIWGCRSSFALLGLGVMPLALVLFVFAWAAGGAGAARRSEFGDAFLAAHPAVDEQARRFEMVHATARTPGPSPEDYKWEGNGQLGDIYTIVFVRGLDEHEVLRRLGAAEEDVRLIEDGEYSSPEGPQIITVRRIEDWTVAIEDCGRRGARGDHRRRRDGG